MGDLYIKVFSYTDDCINIPLESLITFFVFNHCKSSFVINFCLCDKTDCESYFKVALNTKNFNITSKNVLPLLVSYCTLPVIITDNVTVVSGLCSVARQIIKLSVDDEVKKLLGFRQACLMACNESSVWTKFCEIEMFNSIKLLCDKPNQFIVENEFFLLEDLTRYEYHLSQPVKIHNVYKVTKDLLKKNKINNTKEKLELQHLYGEGPFMTLADIILYPLINIAFRIFSEEIFKTYLPLTYNWLNNVKNQVKEISFQIINSSVVIKHENAVVKQSNIKKQSLYISDPQRYKPKNRIFTKQPDIINALNLVKQLNLCMNLEEKPFGNEIEFDWSKIPLEANPEGGALPKSRMKRKCEQLENLAKAVIKIAKPGQRIVDFCSGAGHLGILLAVQLPKCSVILLENKEISLSRARERVSKLQLNNVTLLQCNLDYFTGNFDIGISLHACGVATDLVIQHCLQQNAVFVCCPCCYGGVHACHHISYPRSENFRNLLTLEEYLTLGHSADQTHDANNSKTKQGIQCMDIIDIDRKLQAEQMGYIVKLSKMIPSTCTPKNNILIGFPNQISNRKI